MLPVPLRSGAFVALAEGPPELAGPDLTRYLLVCAAMVLGVAMLGWLLQRTVARSVRGRAARRALRVLDVLPLGGKKRLAVVRVYDRTLVLGLGDRSVNLVTELDREVGVEEELVPAVAAGGGLKRAFEQIRARVAEGRPNPAAAAPPGNGANGTNGTNGKTATNRANGTTEANAKPATARKRAAAAAPAEPATRSRLGDGRGLLG